MFIEVSVDISKGGLADMETFDTIDVNRNKLADPKYREEIAAKVLNLIDEAVADMEKK